MLVDAALLLLGGLMLYFGAEWLVRGAAGLAESMGVSPLVIGLTVVAWGTSAPELAVSIVSALGGKPEIAIGNVVGSNIANIGLILGVTAIIAPPRVDGSLVRRELPVLAAATLALPLLLTRSPLGRVGGALFVAAAALFTWATLRWSRGPVSADAPPRAAVPRRTGIRIAQVVGGLALLLAGGKVFVSGAVELALHVGMSERVVGLTIVAIGTSLPELAASLVAAMRGHSELAVGNVVGSNIFNILLILGLTSVLRPLGGDVSRMHVDLGFLLGLTVLGIWSMRCARSISRAEGALLIAGYAGFVTLLALS